MLQKLTTYILAKREKGQSLVEVAHLFPHLFNHLSWCG